MSDASRKPSQKPGCLPAGYDANSILTVEEMAVWLRLCTKIICRRARGGIIPAMRRGKSYRFHVGTVLNAQTKGKK